MMLFASVIGRAARDGREAPRLSSVLPRVPRSDHFENQIRRRHVQDRIGGALKVAVPPTRVW